MSHAPLPFATPALHDATTVRQVIGATQAMGNDLSFANLFLLREKYNTTIAVADDFLFRHYAGNTRFQGYAFPCGTGDIEQALAHIESDAAAHGRELRFCLLTEEDARLLRELRPRQFHFSTDAGDTDYLYRQSDLADLPGTAYHKKRNHIAQFYRQYPHWTFAPLTRETISQAQQVAEQWYAAQGSTNPALLHEQRAIHSALTHVEELSLLGGILSIDNEPIAMTLASYITPHTVDIHYEKCLPQFRDAYPIINREMARSLQATWINREEDLNIPGLRQAKLSYRPARLLHKYSASLLASSC